MITEIPEFLLEMSERMNSDENRCTSNPYWQVRCNRYLVTEEGYNEHHREVVDDDIGVVYSELQPLSLLHEYLIEHHEDWCKTWAADEHDGYEDWREAVRDHFDMDSLEWPDNVRVLHMQEVEEVVWTGFTEKCAVDFIKRKQHDYPPLFTYVESAYWSPELRQLQDWVKSLSGSEQ